MSREQFNTAVRGGLVASGVIGAAGGLLLSSPVMTVAASTAALSLASGAIGYYVIRKQQPRQLELPLSDSSGKLAR